MISLVEDLLLQAGEIVHDEGLLSGVDEVETVGSGEESEAADSEQLTELVRHYRKIIF
jgi:hypothetical protein